MTRLLLTPVCRFMALLVGFRLFVLLEEGRAIEEIFSQNCVFV